MSFIKQSLREILTTSNNKKITKETPRDYTWETFYSVESIRKWVGTSQMTEERIEFQYDSSFAPTGGYCQSLTGVTEAVRLNDGRVLVCAITSEFGGTFQSHDNIEVNHYGLTPIKK